MSAFIVSTSTIEAIVTFAMRHLDSIEQLPGTSAGAWIPIRAECPDAIGQELLDENYRSVNYRYRTANPAPRYRHRSRLAGNVHGTASRALTPIDIINWTERLRRRWCSLLVRGRTEPVE